MRTCFAACGLAVQRIHASGDDLHVRDVRRTGKARLVAARNKNQNCRQHVRLSGRPCRPVSIHVVAHSPRTESNLDLACIAGGFTGRVFATRVLMAATGIPNRLRRWWRRVSSVDCRAAYHSCSFTEGVFRRSFPVPLVHGNAGCMYHGIPRRIGAIPAARLPGGITARPPRG